MPIRVIGRECLGSKHVVISVHLCPESCPHGL
jgi:hypothetical protein